jgi:hypothetical protein
MDARDRDLFARFDRNDELIVQLQREMLSGEFAQAQELAEIRQSVELAKMEPPAGASAATKAKAIGTILASVIVALVTAAVQNGWLAESKATDPKQLPIPVSTYQ